MQISYPDPQPLNSAYARGRKYPCPCSWASPSPVTTTNLSRPYA